MSDYVSLGLRQLVAARAEHCCEYCLYPQRAAFLSFTIEHIIARKHDGPTHPDNLALACPPCNRYKGSDIASLDPLDGSLTPLFHPRQMRWSAHFRLAGATITPLTAQGRATVRLLQFNHPDRIAERELLIQAGVYPPAHIRTMPEPTDNQEPVDLLTVGDLITLAEAAEYAGLAKGSLLVYAKSGRLKAKKLGSQWVTTRAAIDEYLASRSFDNIPKKYRDRA